ncbi:MAG: hypothetical protein ACE5JU_23415 [Candidatus Binatia bacterium]
MSESDPFQANERAVKLARSEVDRLRLDLERYRQDLERRRTYLEHYKAELEPQYRYSVESDRASVGFAQSGIRSMYILNGGALIALPAFHTLLKDSPTYTSESLMWSAGAFVIGLLFSGVTSLLAYLAQSATTEAVSRAITWRTISVNETYWPRDQATKPTADEEIDAEKKKERQWRRRFVWFAWLGVGSSVAALAAFVAGAVTALSSAL